MPTTHPVSVASETHGLAGNLVLPDGAAAEAPVPSAVILGGPGPLPLQRYSPEGAKQWPVLWSEALGKSGLGALSFDQRGSGLSSGQYHDADWDALYEDARASVEMLAVQPEVGKVAAIAWGDGCAFALQLAAASEVDAVVLMAPAYHTAEERYERQISALAARSGLSERVVQLRVKQWRQEIMATAERVQCGETTATTAVGGKPVTTNLVRFLQVTAFDPSAVAPHVKVPVLILHGQDDTVIPPSESEALADTLPDFRRRVLYPDTAHFVYRSKEAMAEAARFLKDVLQ